MGASTSRNPKALHGLYRDNFTLYIQSDPGGKINILGGHTVGHSKQETAYIHGFYSERSLYSSRIVDKKNILHDTGIYCSSDKVGTAYLV
jgi:hypothetical protein